MQRMDPTTITPAVFDTQNYVVLDFETDTSFGDYGHAVHPENAILLACYKGAGDTIRAQWGDEYAQGELIAAVEAADLLVAHNSQYELAWLKRAGLDLSNVLVFDTKLAEYVLMGNLAAGDDLNRPRSTSLDDCCIRRGWAQKDPVVDVMISHGINPVRIPRPWLEGRCRQDVLSTEALFLDQREALRASGRLGVMLTRCLVAPLLAEISLTGMRLDAARVEAAYKQHVSELAKLTVEMAELDGGINWKSGKQVAEFLYNPRKPQPVLAEDGSQALDKSGQPLFTRPGLGFKELKKPNGDPKRTAKGKKMTDQKTIDKLAVTNKAQEQWVGVRKKIGKVNAALTKSLLFFQVVCEKYGAVFHANINQTTTATHRTSSTGIPVRLTTASGEEWRSAQFQNLPNAFKPLFTARGPNRKLCEADGSQLEFRTAGQVSRCAQMVADILDPDFDAHITSAAAMHGVTYEELLARYRAGDPEAIKWRKAAKPDTFGPLYGKSFGTPEQLLWIEAFRQRYKGFYEYSESNVFRVLRDKVLRLPWGMRYYWPYAKISGGKNSYVNCKTAVYNYPIQGFATAEIIPVAIASFRARVREAVASGLLKADDILILNTVHDSIICDVADEAVEVWKELAKQAFTTDVYAYLRNVYNYEFDLVPLGVGLNIGTHWADEGNAEEEWDVFPDGRRNQRK